MAERGGVEVPTLVLASTSPRRETILRRFRLDPIIVPTDVDETPIPGENAPDLVERLARAKAKAGWVRSGGLGVDVGRRLVVAADTVVEIDGRILGKPSDPDEARAMLNSLSGRQHHVLSGVAISRHADAAGGEDQPEVLSTTERTAVWFRDLDDSDVEWYLGTGEPLDKAGGYGIQDMGALLVERVDGSYANVVGLPVVALDRLTRKAGWPLHTLARSSAPESNEPDPSPDVGAVGHG